MHEKYTTGKVTQGNSPTGKWYESYVAYAKKNNIITVDYNWETKATRAGYISIFAHALPDSGLKAINEVPDGSIPDVPMSHAQAADIYKLYRAGIIQGVDSQFTCNHAANIKRSEVAAILTRMMDESARKKFTTVTTGELNITTQPKDVTVKEGEDAAFSVAASGGKAPYKYEWRYYGGPEEDYALLNGDKATYTSKGCALSENGDQYYCVITDANGKTVTSNKATLTVTAAATELKITSQPQGITVEWGDGHGPFNPVFSVAVSGGKAPYK